MGVHKILIVVFYFVFSSDDQSIISGESQQGLFWWNLNLDDLLNRGCDRLSDYLSTNPNVSPKDQKLCR